MVPSGSEEHCILVVDDENFVLNLSVKILNKLGYSNIVTANNGADALARLNSSQHMDVIICDLNMPQMDGVEFMRHAAKNDFSGGVIFLSGEDERILETARDLAKAYDLNMLGVLPKPLQPEALQKLLEKFRPGSKKKNHYTPQASISEQELRDGLNGAQLLLVYQPKISIKTGKIAGVESLSRWKHPERGILGPGAFIPLAEKLGLIHELSEAIYRNAVKQTAEWLARGINIKTSVNFSINSFIRPEFHEFLLSTLDKENVDPAHMILEVTESQIMNDALNCLEVMMRLRMKKFGLSIDDFGTGQSSLEQLKRIPFTELKIDRAFVYGAATDKSARAILESSVDLAKKLKMEIVAEGGETREDWDIVEELGCDYMQGFYCAKPMTAAELDVFMQNWTGPH